jgi:ParB family chromosome partitioning protein
LTDAECAELALLENVQRSNLSVIEEARGYKRLMLQFRMKEERMAKKVGKSVGTIKETMKLLQLTEAVQKLLAEKKLTASHGHALLPLAPFERVCVLVANKAVKDHLTATSL